MSDPHTKPSEFSSARIRAILDDPNNVPKPDAPINPQSPCALFNENAGAVVTDNRATIKGPGGQPEGPATIINSPTCPSM